MADGLNEKIVLKKWNLFWNWAAVIGNSGAFLPIIKSESRENENQHFFIVHVVARTVILWKKWPPHCYGKIFDIKLYFFFRFKTKAMHISGLLKDRQRTPLQETCDWLEYVVRHGGAQHLRAQVFNIPWYQYYLLDVMTFLVAIGTIVVMVMRLTCRCLCRFCCKKGDKKTKKE